MGTRYHITLGARTSAGGKVISASAFRAIHGANIACEGDAIFCPACKSQGIIELHGARLNERVHGKQVSLSDDLCRCKCVPPPRLIAVQSVSKQTIGEDEAEHAQAQAAAHAAQLNAAETKAESHPDELPFVMLDPKTDEPYRHRRYRLELQGRIIEGVTDQHGLTVKLNAADRAAVSRWHVDDDSAQA